MLWLGAALLCAGCQTVSLNDDALQEAREAYGTAQNDARVRQHAPIELERARTTLQHAEAAWREGDPALGAHLAYLARQRALTATEIGVRADAEAQIAVAQTERDRLQLRSQLLAAAQRDATVADQRAADEARARAMSPAERNARLQAELAGAEVRATDRGLVLTLPDELFDPGSALLRTGATPTLDQIAATLRAHPERQILVEGFTDSEGSEAGNLDLSTRRAEAVREALVARGISAQRIAIQGYGEAFPVASNSTFSGRQLNRRVEILFSDVQGHIAGRPMRGFYGSQPRRP
jgi:outer membrane protein OmpA-like peptidoglycan-associated protein